MESWPAIVTTAPFFTLSPELVMKPVYNSLRTDEGSQPYHEVIYLGHTKPVAKIMHTEDGYWWILNHNHAISRGYRSVADAKRTLFPVLDSVYS